MMPWILIGVVCVCALASASFALGAMWGGRRNASTDDDLAVSERVNTLLRQQLVEATHSMNRLEIQLRQRALTVAGLS